MLLELEGRKLGFFPKLSVFMLGSGRKEVVLYTNNK